MTAGIFDLFHDRLNAIWQVQLHQCWCRQKCKDHV